MDLILSIPSLIAWFVFWGIVCAVIAAVKGRDLVGWFLAGALLSPVAALIVALLPSKPTLARKEELTRLELEAARARQAGQARAESEMRPCPFCAEPIRRAAKICRFCNREVEPTVDGNSAPSWPSSPQPPGLPPINLKALR